MKFYNVKSLAIIFIALLIINLVYIELKTNIFYESVNMKIERAKIMQSDLNSKYDYLTKKYRYSENIKAVGKDLNSLDDEVNRLDKYLNNKLIYPYWR